MTATENPVRIRTHALEKEFEDADKRRLRVLLVVTNTAGVQDFDRVISLEFIAPKEGEAARLNRIKKQILISEAHRFENAAISIFKIVDNARVIPSTVRRPYREYSVDVFEGVSFGSAKHAEEERTYFIEASENGEQIRVSLGDLSGVHDLRYFFTEAQRYQ